MSFPTTVGQVPIYYNVENTGRPYESNPDEKYVSKYLDTSNYALYPFGYGLSYGTVRYQKLQLSSTELSAGQSLRASIDVVNESTYERTETVQLYLRDVVAMVARPIKELKGFKQIQLQAHETKTVSFEVTEALLRYVHPNQQWGSDPGEFELWIGPNSATGVNATFQLV